MRRPGQWGMVPAVTSRIRQTFERLGRQRRAALIPYITAGDPDLGTTAHVLDALVEGGADVIELGVPFSDPMADGPIIQQAMTRALARPIALGDILETVAAFRERHPDVPLVLFGYLNPLHRYGLERACHDAARAGADGFLVVDLPAEEAGELTRFTRPAELDFIGLFTPTSDAARVRTIAEHASGFAYCVSVAGVTGGEVAGAQDLPERVAAIREGTGLPVAVGFGIRTPEDAARVAGFADGVVVGSALVDAMAGRAPVEAPAVASEFLRSLREAMDEAVEAG
ncbi:MAG: tryptophan synthase subunit alpha [Myxococcota bacterium]